MALKKCEKCNNGISENDKFCPQCGTTNNNTKVEKISLFNNKKTLLIIIVIVAAIIIIFNWANEPAIESNNQNNSNNTTNNESNNNATNNTPTKNHVSFDETFIFDNLVITIGSGYTFDKIDNRFSEYNNQDVIKLPITVKNLSNDIHSLNMFYYDVYGPTGIEIETFNSYFDDNIDYAGNLRNGASYTKYIYVLYDGNGEYAIEFDNWSDNILVEFTIQK